MQQIEKLLKLLTENDVQFVVIGGVAATLHGASMVTEDIDFCIPFTVDNMKSLLQALKDIDPHHREVGDDRALTESAERLSEFRNLYLKTELGYIVMLSEVKGVGDFDATKRASVQTELFGVKCPVLDMDALIEAKKHMSRPKDKETVVQLEAIREKKGLGIRD